MKTNENDKSLGKDIGKLLLIWIPLLFVIVGGAIWKNDGFVGTVMQELFPALFFGLFAMFIVIVIASNLLPNHPKVWWGVGLSVGTIMVITRMSRADGVFTTLFVACCIAICLLAIIRWIKGK